MKVLAAVGTVEGNRGWLDEHLPPPAMPQLDDLAQSGAGEGGIADWGNIFDAGDEAVQDEIRRQEG